MTVTSRTAPDERVGAPIRRHQPGREVALGLGVAGVGLLVALAAHRLVPAVGALTWAVGLGVAAANLGLLREPVRRALALVTRRLLRVGIVLLGFSVSFAAVVALGLPLLGVVAGGLVGTLVFTFWVGTRLGLSRPRAVLLGVGTAICGASAIAAVEEPAEAEGEDVTVAIAMVTLFGSIALVLLPLLRGPLGLSDLQYGLWAGASVHEVGQVVAAASPAGAGVVATAIVVKLTRVLMLAPVVAAIGAVRRRHGPVAAGTRRPPVVPLFVLGFVACAAVRSAGVVPIGALAWITQIQVAALGAALFGMGASVRVGALLKRSGPTVATAAAGALFISLSTLGGLLLVT